MLRTLQRPIALALFPIFLFRVPLGWFPEGLEIDHTAGTLTVRRMPGAEGLELVANWGQFGPFLCAWVYSAPRPIALRAAC